jgi:hypothetical protein
MIWSVKLCISGESLTHQTSSNYWVQEHPLLRKRKWPQLRATCFIFPVDLSNSSSLVQDVKGVNVCPPPPRQLSPEKWENPKKAAVGCVLISLQSATSLPANRVEWQLPSLSFCCQVNQIWRSFQPYRLSLLVLHTSDSVLLQSVLLLSLLKRYI